MLAVLWFILLFNAGAYCEGLEFVVVDVGMAECMIVTCGQETMVIDTAYIKNEEMIRKALDQMGVESIKYLVLTHPHADHISGTQWMLETYGIDVALLPPVEYGTEVYNEALDALMEYDIKMIYPHLGDLLHLGDATVTVYGPHPVIYDQENNWSIVLMIEYAGRRILLTGDTQMEAEMDMLSWNEWLPLKADILKVAHHGSNTSSSYQFIAAVAPDYAIVSCGKNEDDFPMLKLQ